MRIRLLGLVLVFLLAVSPCLAQRAAIASKQEVLAAIDRLQKTPLAKDAGKDISTVMTFARDSEAVVVTLSSNFISVGQAKTKQEQSLETFFMAYYVAGAIQHDLKNPKKIKDVAGEATLGVKSVLNVYRVLKKRNPKIRVALYEKLTTLEKQGKLSAYIKSAAKNTVVDTKSR